MKAIQKNIRTSPRKIRLIADAIRSLDPSDALVHLKLLNKRAATPLAKTIQQALANAKATAGIDASRLKFKHIEIGKGPTYKRWRAVSRGSAHSIFKRTSNIRVILEEKNGSKS